MSKPSYGQKAYERGFIDGMQHQMKSSVDKAVNAMTQPKQEPVTWMNKHGACMSAAFKEVDATAGEYTTPLYTSPPKREWVGLTEDEIKECFKITPDLFLPWHIYKRI